MAPTWQNFFWIKMNFKPQVSKEHYFRGYDTKERVISYWYQINEVIRTNPKKVK